MAALRRSVLVVTAAEAAATSPSVLFMASRLSAKRPAFSPASCNAVLPASMDPNISIRVLSVLSAYSDISVSMSAIVQPSSIRSWKFFSPRPAAFAASVSPFAPVCPCFPNSARRELRPVIASSVCVPAAVVVASAAPICSSDTPKDAAVGITRASPFESWPIVVMPLFCVWISTPCTRSASSHARP